MTSSSGPPFAPIVTSDADRGPKDPASRTPTRTPRSVRRTSTIDACRADFAGEAVVTGVARDLRTLSDGEPVEIGVATVDARIAPDRTLGFLATAPDRSAAQALLGTLAGPGFRRHLDEALPEERDGHTRLYQLLDDLPVLSLISGYVVQRAGQVPKLPRGLYAPTIDLCAGWQSGGVLMNILDAHDEVPMTVGPIAPDLVDPADPIGWHDPPPLLPHSMRRRRRTDVRALDGGFEVDALFRDSHADDAGVETIVHEYSLHATIDAADLVVRDATARAHVLPYIECPQALASAGRIAGRSVAELRTWVRGELKGTSTCTHLNDMLRSLGDLAVLIPAIDPAPRAER